MVECLINHVAIDVDDIEEAIDFYTDLFDMERVPKPESDLTYVWLEFGDQQLHIVERGEERSPTQHFALIVDDFETVWDRAVEWGVLGEDTGYVRALPSGLVQCYIHDPSGNRVEFMWPDVETLPDRITDHVDYIDTTAPTDGPAGATIASNINAFQDGARDP